MSIGDFVLAFCVTRLYTMPVGVSITMYQIQGAGPSYGISMSAAILMSVLPIVAFLLM